MSDSTAAVALRTLLDVRAKMVAGSVEWDEAKAVSIRNSIVREADLLLSDYAKVVQESKAKDDELETLRLQLAACGVAAMMNTRESTGERIGPASPYYSASYRDVCNAVDREMDLREKLEKLQAST